MKKYTIFLFVFSITLIGYSQCPTEELILRTQAEIDNFATNYPNCTILTHELIIDGENSDITNLLGMSGVVQAEALFIKNTQVQDLFGLNNLLNVEDLAIWGNPNLHDMSGLTQLQSAGGLEIWINNGVENLGGMNSLQSLGRLNLFANANLVDITDLSFVQSLTSLTLGGNGLTNLAGFENLQSVSGDLSLSGEMIQNVDEFSNIQSIGGSLYLAYLHNITDITGFSNLTSLAELYVLECLSLTDLAGFESLETIAGRLRIGFNPELTALYALGNLTAVGAIEVYENAILENVTGFENITSVAQNVYIMDNPLMNDISAVENIVPEGLSEVVIARNPNLSVCDNDFVCGVIFDPSISEFISDNAVGCGSVPQVAAHCLLESNDFNLEEAISIAPNPVRDNIRIELAGNIQLRNVVVLSSLGQVLSDTKNAAIDFSMVSQGVYFVKIDTDMGSVVRKVVKE